MPTNKDVVQELQEILREWEDNQNDSLAINDPLPHLIKLCELFERETINFLKQDPDPFDDRHPVTSKPDSALGHILRALFKKDAFVTKLVNPYLRDNYFTSMGVTKDSTPLNTAACRLLLDLLHGLDIPQVFRESETTVMRLFNWAEKGPDPLRTYATGLLAAAMDIPDLATSFREQNTVLVPIILERLWELKGQHDPPDIIIPERPFANLNGKNEEMDTVQIKTNGLLLESNDPQARPKLNISPVAKDMKINDSSALNSDCSNSSWAEMSSYILGTYQMHPITKQTKELFILKYLKPVGEYQESLGHFYKHKAWDLVFHYLNVRNNNHARLSFEALRFLGSLLFHKKFCLEFVNRGGIQKLLLVPRPSLPADGVALCLWYLAYCEEAIERICLLSESILTDLMRYTLWLLECSHQSSRTHAVMFCGMVFKFRTILDKFDEQDGLRRMLNILSTLPIFQENWDQDISDEPHEVMMWQTVKHVCQSLKHYFESHLTLRVNQLQRYSTASSSSSSCSSLSSYQHTTPAYKALNITQDIVERNIEYLLEHLPHRARWKPVENFVALKGLNILLELVAVVLNDSFTLNRIETAVSALDSLYVCSVMPHVQTGFCEKMSIPAGDDLFQNSSPGEVPGYAILVACIPENSQTISSSPEVQKSTLNILVNCLCTPIHRVGSPVSSSFNQKIAAVSTPPNKKRAITNEDIVKKSWDCVRTSNGIMYLLKLLHKKVPITDADCIRGLACRALVGLSRSDTARQIMSKLPIFSSGELQLLMKEPILQEKRIEHVKFQQYALDLIKAVSGRFKSQDPSGSDVSILSIHKASVVAQTRINYNKHQLLQLIHKYLHIEGYQDVAEQLLKEAALTPIPNIGSVMGPPPRVSVGTPPPGTRNTFINGSAVRHGVSSLAKTNGANSVLSNNLVNPKIVNVHTNLQESSNIPIQIKQLRTVKKPNSSQMPTVPSSSFCKSESVQSPATSMLPSINLADPSMSLDRIVVEYLTNQHALCQNPVVTCPTFDLFQPHRCPEPKLTRRAKANFTSRHVHSNYTRSSSRFRSYDRKFIYSRFRPSHVYRPANVDKEVFLTCAFSADSQKLLVGTTRGEVSVYNNHSDAVVSIETVHEGPVTSLAPHNECDLLLTSCSSTRQSVLWSTRDMFDSRLSIDDCHHAEFSNSYDKMLGTMEDKSARLYDIKTCQVISEFTPKLSNHYHANKAALDPLDELILTDGVLFDVRSGKQVHKFDKINPILNGIFHRNGLEIISSSEIWDLRTFHLLRTAPVLSLCDIFFDHGGDVIFGIMCCDMDDSQGNAYETSFKTVDARDYSSIATVDVRRIVKSLAINCINSQIAVVETDNGPEDLMENAVVRLYDVGMTRQDDEAMDDDDDDDLGSDEEESDDSDDDNDGEDDDQLEQGSLTDEEVNLLEPLLEGSNYDGNSTGDELDDEDDEDVDEDGDGDDTSLFELNEGSDSLGVWVGQEGNVGDNQGEDVVETNSNEDESEWVDIDDDSEDNQN